MTLRNLWLCAFALTSLLMFAGCQTAPTPEPKRDVVADTTAVNALRDQYATAFNASDAAAVAATFADDGIEMIPNQAAVEGKQAIQGYYEAMFKGSSAKTAAAPLETQVAGDWAYDRGNYTVAVTPKSGKPMEESGKYLVICKRQPDASWKIYRLIYNSNDPLPGAPGKKK